MPSEQEILKLQKAYSDTFKSKEGQIVLEDLQKICFKNTTTVNENIIAMASNEGMRMVMLHIETRMKMTLKNIPKREEQ